MEGLQKVLIWFLDADDSPNSHQNIIITVTVQNRPAHNRPLKTDHSKQTTL